MLGSVPTTIRPMSPRTGGGWQNRWALSLRISSPRTRSIRPTWWWRRRRGTPTPGHGADAIVTQIEGLSIGASAADCGPVLFVDPTARAIGAAHAGWKGALTGVLESTIAAMEKLGAERGRMIAAIGPLIRQPSYEVGGEFVERFIEADAENGRFFIPSVHDGHSMFDLGGFIRIRLENAGILMIDDTGIDTYADERFYSYRARSTARSRITAGTSTPSRSSPEPRLCLVGLV